MTGEENGQLKAYRDTVNEQLRQSYDRGRAAGFGWGIAVFALASIIYNSVV